LSLTVLVSPAEVRLEERAKASSLLSRIILAGFERSEKVREPEAYSLVKEVKAPEKNKKLLFI